MTVIEDLDEEEEGEVGRPRVKKAQVGISPSVGWVLVQVPERVSSVLSRLISILETQSCQQEWQILALELLARSVDWLVSLQSRAMEDVHRQAVSSGFGSGSGDMEVDDNGEKEKENDEGNEEEP